METQHHFFRTSGPGWRDYIWPVASALIALILNAAAIIVWLVPSQRGSDADNLTISVLAPLAWTLPAFLFWPVLTQRNAYLKRNPALTIDASGLSFPSLIGSDFHFPWIGLELGRTNEKGETFLHVRSGSTSVMISLKSLDKTPDEIVNFIEANFGKPVIRD